MKNSLPPAGDRARLLPLPGQDKMPGFRIRLPLLLYSYIANELLAPFFASFTIICSVFFLIRLIPLLDVVLELRKGNPGP